MYPRAPGFARPASAEGSTAEIAEKAKMHAGIPLTEADRTPWLGAVHAVVARAIDRREPLIVACSALARRYRITIAGDAPF